MLQWGSHEKGHEAEDLCCTWCAERAEKKLLPLDGCLFPTFTDILYSVK